jgi:hypothetical protein
MHAGAAGGAQLFREIIPATAAIALLVMLGALCATLVERIKSSGGRHSSAQRT